VLAAYTVRLGESACALDHVHNTIVKTIRRIDRFIRSEVTSFSIGMGLRSVRRGSVNEKEISHGRVSW
jgi:hypothetical protein